MIYVEVKEALGAEELGHTLAQLLSTGRFEIKFIMQSLDSDYAKHFTVVAFTTDAYSVHR